MNTNDKQIRKESVKQVIEGGLLDKFGNGVTYNDLQDYFQYRYSQDVPTEFCCPLCHAKVIRYRRTITINHIDFLLALSRLMRTKKEPYHYYKDIQGLQYNLFKTCSTDYAILKLFGLIEGYDKSSGMFTLSPEGRNFIKLLSPVPSYLIVLNNKIIETSNATVFANEIKTSINDILLQTRPFEHIK